MLLSFNFLILGGEIVTEGVPRHVYVVKDMNNNKDDPIFSVPGGIIINRHNKNGRNRIFVSRSERIDNNNENLYGLGNEYFLQGAAGMPVENVDEVEISNARNCSYQLRQDDGCEVIAQGSDYTVLNKATPAYGSYSIYLSKDAERFDTSSKRLKLKIEEW